MTIHLGSIQQLHMEILFVPHLLIILAVAQIFLKKKNIHGNGLVILEPVQQKLTHFILILMIVVICG